MNGLLRHLFTGLLLLSFVQLVAWPTLTNFPAEPLNREHILAEFNNNLLNTTAAVAPESRERVENTVEVMDFVLTIADAAVDQGTNVCLPITVQEFTNILGMQFSINYEGSILTYTGAQNFNPAMVGFTAASIGNPSAGNLTFTWNDPFAAGVTLPNGATMVELCFDVVGNNESTVSFSGSPTPIEIINGDEMEVPFNSESGTVTVNGGGGPGPTGFNLTLADVTANQGDNVCLPITVTDFNSILGMQFSVNYNATALSYTGAQNFNSAMVGFTAASIGNPSPGNLTFTWNDPFAAGVTLPNGATMVELCFDVVGNSTSTVSFSGSPTPIEIIDGNEMNVPFNSESGTVTVNGGGGPSGFTLTLADVNASTGSNVCLPITVNDFNSILGMQFSVNYDATALNYTGAQNFNAAMVGFTAASIGNPSPGNLTFTWNDPFAAGVTLPNGATMVELCFDVTGTTTTTVSFSGNPTPIEIINADEMEVPFNSESGTITLGAPTGLVFTLADLTANQGDNVCLPMTVTNFTNIASMQYNVTYDASILTFTGAQSFNTTLPGWGAASITNPSPGTLTVNWTNASGVSLTDNSSLVTLCFDVTGGTTSNVSIPTPITVQDGDGAAVNATSNSGTVTVNPPIEGFTLILPNATANAGDNVCLPITVNDFENILGMQFSINYDAAALTYTGAQNFNPALVGWTAASIGNPTPGNLTTTWNDPFAAGVTLPDGATLVEICFDVLTDMSTTIVFSGMPTPIEVIDGNEMEVEFNSIAGTISPDTGNPNAVTLTLADVTANQGDNVCLPLTVTNFVDVQSMQFNLNYDASVLTFTGAQNFNSTLPNWGTAQLTNPSPGVLAVNWTNTSGVTLENGSILVTVCFDVTGTTTSNVTFPAPTTLQDSNGTALEITTSTGTVTVNPPIEGFTLILADATANSGENVCLPITVNDFTNILGMQFSINYDAAALTYTGAQNFNPTLIGWTAASIGNPTPGNLTTTWNDPFAAGVTLPDGDVLVELCFDVLTDVSTTIVFSGMPTPIEVIDGNEMEVEFNSIPGTISPPTSGPLPITLALSDVTANQGDNVCLNLTVTNFTDIQSMQYNLNYDAAILSFTGAQNFNATLPGWGAASITNPSPGVLTVNWSNASGVSLNNGSTLVSLCFDVTGNTTSNVTIPAPITIQNGDGVTVTTNTNNGVVTINPPLDGFTLILADATASAGENVCLPITVNDFTNILGMQFSINYDAAALTYTGAQNFNPTLVGWTTASIGNPTPGNLTTTWNDPFAAGVTLPDGDVLVELCFDVLTDVSTTIVFSGMPTPIEVIDGNEMEVEFNSIPGTISPPTSGPLPITLTLSDVTADQGDNVCLNLTVTNFTDIQSMQYNINYNSSILGFTGAQNFNATLPGWGTASITNPSPGVLTVSWSNASGVSLANGSTLVSLCFDVNGDMTSDVTIPAPINIQNGDGAMVTTNTNSGTVAINPPLDGFALILADVTAEQGTNVCVPMTVNDFTNILGMQYSVNYDATALTYTGAQNFNPGLVGWTAASIGNPTPGNLTTTWNDPFAAGATLADGAVLVELCFTVNTDMCTDIVFSGTPTPIEIIDGNEMEVPFTGISGSVCPPMEDPGTFAVSLSTEEACQGDAFCLDLTASTFTNIQGMQFSITFNSADLSFAQVNNINPGLPGLTTANFNPATGVITFQWDSSSGTGVSLNPNAVLFSLCFNKLTDNATSVTIGGSPTAIEISDSNGNVVPFNGTTGQVTCDPVQPLMFGQVDVVNLTCANDPIGSITIVSMLNGTGPYTYNWQGFPGETSNSLSGLPASTVTVVVTDTQTGMMVSGTYNVTAPPAITTTVENITNILCAGESTGSITVSASGGVGNFQYTWNNGLPNGPVQNDLPAGAYSVTITDGNGCQESINNMLVNELSDPIVLTGAVTAISGDGTPGNINLSVSGGGSSFSYSWIGPSGYAFTGQDPNNITVAGEYCVTVTDNFGCVQSTCFDICESLFLVTFGISDACAGESNGDVGITVTGGCCPEMNTYSWISLATNMQVSTAQDLADQPAGNYRVIITDCTNESIAADFTIGENPPIAIAGMATDVMNLNDGTITLTTVSGGSGAGYTFAWTGPNAFSSNMQNITGLISGTYCVTVTDDDGCTEEMCFAVNATVNVVSVVAELVSCPGEEDGCVQITVSGGQPPMSVTIFDSDNVSVGTYNVPPSGIVEVCTLSAGEYTFEVSDSNVGNATGMFTVGSPAPISDMATIVNDTEDNGGSGNVTVLVNGGTGSPEITWNGYPSGPTVMGIVGPVTITGTIQDDNGCTFPISYTVLQLTEEAEITNAGCADSANGEITVTAAGATEPYTFAWATGEMTATITDLLPGTYTVTITDGTGANLIRNYEVTAQSDYEVSADIIAEPDCFDSNNGQIEAFINSNGTSMNFSYEFVLDGTTVATNTDGMLDNAAPGTYLITVVDEFECAATATVVLTAPDPINLPAEVDRISCDGETDGRIELNPTGGTAPYEYEWSTGQTTRIIGGLVADSYSVTLTDANDCQVIDSYTVMEAMPIIVTIETTPHDDADNCNGSVMAIVLGGEPPYTYKWLNIPGDPNEGNVDNLCAGTYMLQVTDANGCSSAVVSGTVADDRFECFTERVVITPDGNGSNDEFIIFCAEALTDNHLEIYNRWGQLVFETDNYSNDWEGTSFNGDDLPAGPYYWVLDYSSPGSGEPLQRRGSLTIVRDN